MAMGKDLLLQLELLLLSELMESCCLLQLPQQLLPRLQGGTGEDKRPKKSR